MLLNLLRVEGADPEAVMQQSFYQFQQEQRCPELEAAVVERTAERDALVIEDEEAVAECHHLTLQLTKAKEELRKLCNQGQYIVPFLQPGRLAHVRDGDEDFGWGVLLSFTRKGVAPAGSSSEANVPRVVLDMMLYCQPAGPAGLQARPVPCPLGDPKGELRVVPVLLTLLDGVSSVRTYMPKDLRSENGRAQLLKVLRETMRRFPDGLPLLDPVEDLQIDDPALPKVVKRIATLQEKLVANSLAGSPSRDERYAAYHRKLELGEEIRHLRREIKAAKSLTMKDTLKKMKRVLRRLGHVDADNVIQLKGRVACEINTADALLITELIFNGVFNDLSVAQTAAVCSCLVFTDKGSDGAEALPTELAEPLRLLQSAARKIANISQDCKIAIDVEEFVQSFRPDMMEVVFAWVNGSRFVDIMGMTTAFEGTVIRVIRRLEELMRQLADSAKAVGDGALETKFTTASTKMKRDIIFAASLYL